MADDPEEPFRESEVRRAYSARQPEPTPRRKADPGSEPREPAEPRDDSAPPPVTNLDRALPPADRRKARAKRHGTKPEAPAPPPAEHFTLLADRAGLHVFVEQHPPGQRTAILRAVHHDVFPLGREAYFERDSAPQGRFPGNTRQGGMSTDERLPMQQEQERRVIRQVGQAIAAFLRSHPEATWDFAAGAPLHRALLDELEPGMRSRLQRIVPKELTNQPVETLALHFSAVQPLTENRRRRHPTPRPSP